MLFKDGSQRSQKTNRSHSKQEQHYSALWKNLTQKCKQCLRLRAVQQLQETYARTCCKEQNCYSIMQKTNTSELKAERSSRAS